MPRWKVVSEILKRKKYKKVLIVGVAYKKDLDDTIREAPAIDFIKNFKKKKIYC